MRLRPCKSIEDRAIDAGHVASTEVESDYSLFGNPATPANPSLQHTRAGLASMWFVAPSLGQNYRKENALFPPHRKLTALGLRKSADRSRGVREGMSAHPAYGFLDRIEILVLPAQQPEACLEEPFSLCRVGFLVDLSKDCNQLIEFPDQKPEFSALDRSNSGFVEQKSRSNFCVTHLDASPQLSKKDSEIC